MIGILKPAAHREALHEGDHDDAYRRLRLQVFIGIFVGYAGYYLVRKNFSLAMPFLIEAGYSKADLGFALSGVAFLTPSSRSPSVAASKLCLPPSEAAPCCQPQRCK